MLLPIPQRGRDTPVTDAGEEQELVAVLASLTLQRQLAQSHEDVERGDVVDAAEDREALLAAIRSRSNT